MRAVRTWIGWAAAVALPPAIVALLMRGILPDPLIGAPLSHFFVVSLTASLLAGVAGLMTLAALQVRDLRVTFLALAFLGIAGIFLAHALTTPTALVHHNNPWVGFSAYLSLFVAAACLLGSTVAWTRTFAQRLIAGQRLIFAAALAVLIAYNATAIVTSAIPPRGMFAAAMPGGQAAMGDADDAGYGAAAPAVQAVAPSADPYAGLAGGPFTVLSNQNLSTALALATLFLLGLTIWRYALRYRLARSPLIAALLVSGIFLAQAQIVMRITTLWRASWWVYHGLILGAFAAATVGLAREYARSGSLAGVVEGLLLRGTIKELEQGYAEVIVALVGAVEAKDPYTHGHTRRVAELSLLLGEELRLPPERLRILGQAAVLHDIGKIGVPDAILNKTGPLTEAEFAVIKEHPARGHEIIKGVRSLQREIAGVRYHHERLDGTGYPDGLRGEAIPLDARIIAVADVYDALTSDRAYRPAMTHERALAIIDREAGVRLDPQCVAALHRVVEKHEPAGEAAPDQAPRAGASALSEDRVRVEESSAAD